MREAVPLRQFSVFQVGGPADYFVQIKERNDLLNAIEFSEKKKLPIFVMGDATNILFSEKGFRGLVIKMENDKVHEEKREAFFVESGKRNSILCQELQEKGRDFSSFFTVPGTIGGAIAGNAGLWGASIEQYLEEVEVCDVREKKFRKIPADFFRFEHRRTVFHDEPDLRGRVVIWSAVLRFPKGSPKDIFERAESILNMRREEDAWGERGGSIFRSLPDGDIRVYLDLFRGKQWENISVSEKNPNFFRNEGGALQKDFLLVAREIAVEVDRVYGIRLQTEVRIIDEFGLEIPLFKDDIHKGLQCTYTISSLEVPLL